ncbi:MAG: peptidase M20, partial [Oscillospiraceae bacterium]|nr:peptidase M20 [Oscillospiraceae bacterium]
MDVILYSLLALFVVFVLVLVVRALSFKPADLPKIETEEIALNEHKIVDDMVEMIKCKTVSNRDESLVNRAEFAKFEALLKEKFPIIHKTAT